MPIRIGAVRSGFIGWAGVAALIVVELKVVKALEDVHFAVVRSYLRATGREHGLILNFAKPTLEIMRVITSQRPPHDFLASWLP